MARDKLALPQSSRGQGAIIEDYFTIGNQLTKDSHGAEGYVVRGVRRSDEQQFAVKVIFKERIQEAQVYCNQVRALTEVDHVGIIKLVDWFETEYKLYVVMELATGGELFGRIQQRRFFSERLAASAFRQVLEGVGHMHARGIVHCDLKPENILYADDSDTQLKIADFGFAQFVPARGESKLYYKCGTLSYLAPEILQGTGYDCKVDMWSLGVILYVMLSGVWPFGRASRHPDGAAGVKRNILRAHFRFPSIMFQHISDDAKNMITGLLSLDPTQRLSWDQALEHPWLRDDPPDRVLGAEYLLEIGNFNQCRGMYKLATHSLAGLVSRVAQPDAQALMIGGQASMLARLLEEGSIQPVISLAYSNIADERRNACNALANLALKEEYVDKIISEGGLRRLIQMAFKPNANNDEKFFVALAIARMARSSEYRMAMMQSDANDDDPSRNVLAALIRLASPPPANVLRICRKAVEGLSLLVQEDSLHQGIVTAGALEGMLFQAGQRGQESFRGPTLIALRRVFRQSCSQRGEGYAFPDAINDKLGPLYQQALANKESDSPDQQRNSKQMLEGFASLLLLLQREGLLESIAERGDQQWHNALDEVSDVTLPDVAPEDTELGSIERSPSMIFKATDLKPYRQTLEDAYVLLEQCTGKPSPSIRPLSSSAYVHLHSILWSDRMDIDREQSLMLVEEPPSATTAEPDQLSDESVKKVEEKLAQLTQDRKKLVNVVVTTSEGKRCTVPEAILRVINELTEVILHATDLLQTAAGPG